MGLIQTETVSDRSTGRHFKLPDVLQPYYQPTPAPPAPFSTNFLGTDPSFGNGMTSAWALTVTTSTNIMVFGMFIDPEASLMILRLSSGAGLYSFFQVSHLPCSSMELLMYTAFQDYNQSCLSSFSCQTEILDVNLSTSISVYSLSTIATTFQLSVNQQGIINQNRNRDGMASTVTAWNN